MTIQMMRPTTLLVVLWCLLMIWTAVDAVTCPGITIAAKPVSIAATKSKTIQLFITISSHTYMDHINVKLDLPDSVQLTGSSVMPPIKPNGKRIQEGNTVY